MDQAAGWHEGIPSWPQGLFRRKKEAWGLSLFNSQSPADGKYLRRDWKPESKGDIMEYFLRTPFGQMKKDRDVAEYSVMLAVILVIVVGNRPADRIERRQRVLECRQRNQIGALVDLRGRDEFPIMSTNSRGR